MDYGEYIIAPSIIPSIYTLLIPIYILNGLLRKNDNNGETIVNIAAVTLKDKKHNLIFHGIFDKNDNNGYLLRELYKTNTDVKIVNTFFKGKLTCIVVYIGTEWWNPGMPYDY